MTFTSTQNTLAPAAPAAERVHDEQVRSHLAAAVVDGARRASATARRLCWVSVSVTLGFLLVIVVGAAG
jgi:hypothetical protein